MIDAILDGLKSEVAENLGSKFGLDNNQIDSTLGAIKDTVNGTIEKESSNGLEGMLNLFSSQDNNAGGNAILNGLTSNLTSNLVGKLGFDNAKASGITQYLIPIITKLFSDKVGGNESNLLGLLGGSGSAGDMVKNIAGNLLKDKIGGLFGK